MSTRYTTEKVGTPGQGEFFTGIKQGSPWNPEALAGDQRTPFQQDIDDLMAEVLDQGEEVVTYSAELKDGKDWAVTVTETAKIPVNNKTIAVTTDEKVVVTEASPFGVSVKEEESISITGTIFDNKASHKVNPAETGAQSVREQKN